MNEQEQDKERSSREVRRVSRKDRKRKIETGSLFPPDEDARFAPPELVGDKPAPKTVPDDTPLAPDEYALEELIDDEEDQPTTTFAIRDDDERFPPVNPAAIHRPSDVRARSVVMAPKKPSTIVPNLLTLLFVFGTLGVIAFFVIIWIDPFATVNPLPPNTPAPIIITQTPAPTDTPTPPPTETFTPPPTATLTDFVPPPTFTPAPFPFTMANTGVIYAPNGNGQGCNWASIAGSVTDLDGRPLNGFGIHITGENVDETVTSGTVASFGPGSYELFLNGVPQLNPYTIQLLSPQGAPLSDELIVVTSELCGQNVTIVNFVQNRVF